MNRRGRRAIRRRETSSVRRKNARPDDKIDNGLRFHWHIVPENCWPARVRAWPDELRRLRRAPRQRVDARSARSESRRVRRLAPTNRRRRKISTQRTIHARAREQTLLFSRAVSRDDAGRNHALSPSVW